MKLLVTGALRITPEESAELENLGYEIYFMLFALVKRCGELFIWRNYGKNSK